jgi:hypothetical protein
MPTTAYRDGHHAWMVPWVITRMYAVITRMPVVFTWRRESAMGAVTANHIAEDGR